MGSDREKQIHWVIIAKLICLVSQMATLATALWALLITSYHMTCGVEAPLIILGVATGVWILSIAYVDWLER